MLTKGPCRWQTVGVAALFFAGIVKVLAQGTVSAELSGLSILYKLDPRVTNITYGTRWLTGPKYTSTVQPGSAAAVDVKVRGLDALRNLMPVVAEWTAADPDMITVTPGQGDEFRITVQRPGESTLTVGAEGVSTELLVKAKEHSGNAMQVEINEVTTTALPRRAPQRTYSGELPDQRAHNSYAMGLEMGKRLNALGLELDADLVTRGFADALAGDESLLDDDDLRAALAILRVELHDQRRAAGR